MAEALAIQAPAKRLGRWKPGESGNPAGRPRGIDARWEYAKARGAENAAQAIVEVIDAMLLAALCGDTQAARIVLERLCGPVRQEVEVAIDDSPLDEVAMVKRLHSMLAVAALRVQQERN